jgi:hypothetical protein
MHGCHCQVLRAAPTPHLAASTHHFTRALGAELVQRAVQDADCVVEVNGVDRKPLGQVLPRGQPDGLDHVPAAQRGLDVAFQLQALASKAVSGGMRRML